ncbi:hypothetical protein ACVWWR_007967 [Bradyrhizobium sp. LM3.2]
MQKRLDRVADPERHHVSPDEERSLVFRPRAQDQRLLRNVGRRLYRAEHDVGVHGEFGPGGSKNAAGFLGRGVVCLNVLVDGIPDQQLRLDHRDLMYQQIGAFSRRRDALIVPGVAREHDLVTAIRDDVAERRLDLVAVIDLDGGDLDAVVLIDQPRPDVLCRESGRNRIEMLVVDTNADVIRERLGQVLRHGDGALRAIKLHRPLARCPGRGEPAGQPHIGKADDMV